MNRLRFKYINWRGDDHEYVIEPIDGSLVFLPPNDDRPPAWAISGDLVTRDGNTRPELGDSRRRTFVLRAMRDIEEIAA